MIYSGPLQVRHPQTALSYSRPRRIHVYVDVEHGLLVIVVIIELQVSIIGFYLICYINYNFFDM